MWQFLCYHLLVLFSASLSLLCDKGSQQNRTNLDWIGSVGSMKADMEKMKKSALALKEDSSNIPDVLWMVSIDLSIQYRLKSDRTPSQCYSRYKSPLGFVTPSVENRLESHQGQHDGFFTVYGHPFPFLGLKLRWSSLGCFGPLEITIGWVNSLSPN